jgi:hypothetical protein
VSVRLEPFFIPDGDRFVATPSTRGPWSASHQHGGPPTALCARALERLAGDETLPMRLTFDFLRPVPIATLAVKTEVVRAGRKVQRLRAVLLDARGEELMIATAVALRTSSPLPAALGADEPSIPAPDISRPFTFPFFADSMGYHRAVDVRMARGEWGKGATAAWIRSLVPLVAGEPLTPVQRTLIAADSASGLAVVLDKSEHSWLNADLTVALHRPPEGEWIGMDGSTTAEPIGAGLTRARLWDARGPVGVSLQTLVIEKS